MKRKMLSLLLASVLGIDSGLIAKAEAVAATAPTQTEGAQNPALKEKVLGIPPQTMVEVRLRNKEKVRGRLGEVSNEGFALKVAKGDKIEDRKIAFGELKSIKAVGGKGSKAGWIVLVALAGVGVIYLILVAIVLGTRH